VEFGLELFDLADAAGAQQIRRRDEGGVVAVVEGVHQYQPGVAGGVRHLTGLGGVAGQGLFAQHVLARGERFQGPLVVHGDGERVVDGVDVGVVDHGLVAVLHGVDALVRGEGLGACAVTSGDRPDGGTRFVDHGVQERAGCDASGTKDAKSNRWWHGAFRAP